jgi:hypothetical protein
MTGDDLRFVISRRRLLLGAGAAASALAAARVLSGTERWRRLVIPEVLDDLLLAADKPTSVLRLRRRDDLLYLDIDFYNLEVNAADPANPRLVKIKAGVPALVVLRFPSQSLLEEAVAEHEDPGVDVLPSPPARTRISGPSRLAFAIPDELLPLPFEVGNLLNWSEWAPRVVPVASVNRLTSDQPVLPGPTQTAIEAPWWLYLTPSDDHTWDVPTTPTSLRGRTDLWQAALRPPASRGKPALQVIWALDPGYDPDPLERPAPTYVPFPQALSARDRWDIVNNTSVYAFGPLGSIRFAPDPLELERLSLSGLGAWIDGHGRWNPPADLSSLTDWRQRGTFGRDHYVRLVNLGYVFPFGHAAALFEVTERRFTPPPNNPAGKRTAFLRRRVFLVVREPEKEYGGDGFAQRDGGRRFPFTHVEIKTLVTPVLDAADEPLAPGLGASDAFIPSVDGEMLRVHIVGTDWAGKAIEFTSPVIWVDATAAVDKARVNSLLDWYNNLDGADSQQATRVGAFLGQRVHLAGSERDGDTAQPVNTIRWGAQALAANPASGQEYTDAELAAHLQPRFYPTLAQANIRLDAAEQISTRSLGNGGVDIEYQGTFGDSGYTGKAGVYARLVTPTDLTYPGDRSGGVVIPNIQITGLSRAAGPVGGNLDAINADQFDPSEFFANAGASILGAIDLAEVCAATPIEIDESGEATILPIVITRIDGTTITTRLHFSPTLQADSAHVFEPDGNASLEIDTKLVSDLADPSKTTYSIDGDLRNFTVHLVDGSSLNFIDLKFSRLRFTSSTDQKGTIDPQIESAEFKGVLAFLEALQQYLPFGDSGPKIEISPTQVEASVGIDLPSIAFGVFVLENIAFSAGVTLPFTGDPARARFAFSSREDPFHLTVAMFGGGGFFGLELGADGVELFEVALEFGAEVSIDFGAASGGVHTTGGFYWSLATQDSGDEKPHLTAYLDMGGEVDIMGGVASVSIEMYLGMTYEPTPSNKIGGEAEITLEAPVLCFSGAATARLERHFGRTVADPSFGDLMPPDDATAVSSLAWNDYCAAFA